MPPPKQKPTTPILPLQSAALLQPVGGGHEILGHLGAIDLAEELPTLLVVARIAADAGQPVGRERHEIGGAQTPRHIFDIRIEAAIFVHHQHAGQFPAGIGWTHQVPVDGAVALRRRYGGDTRS